MDRVTVSEAARRLGVTPDAVRQRVRRNTIDHEKDEDGRTYVYLDPSDTRRDYVGDASRDAYINALKSQIRLLEDQTDTLRSELEDRKEEARRKDTILLTLAQRVPELESAPEPPGASERPSEEQGDGEGRDGETGEPRRSWLARFFFSE